MFETNKLIYEKNSISPLKTGLMAAISVLKKSKALISSSRF